MDKYKVCSKIKAWVPYYKIYGIKENNYGKSMIFYGNMSRPENYLTVEWVVNNVIPLLDGCDIIFYVIGANPPKKIRKLVSDRVKIVGFIDDPSYLFMNALCLICPLVLGAGIKIKVLESMSASLPVLTNKIGIEGIPAKNGHDFILCEKPAEYAEAIRGLLDGSISASEMEKNARKFVLNNFNV